MSNPIVADNKPKQVNLKQGKEYYFCTCGRFSKQPFCDGSHKGNSRDVTNHGWLDSKHT